GASWLRRWVSRHADRVPHAWCGVLRIARDTRKHDKMAQLAAIVDDDWLQSVDVESATKLCGWMPSADGFFLSEAGWVSAPDLVNAMLDHPLISLNSGVGAKRIEQQADGWRLALDDDQQIDTPLLLITTAFDTGLVPLRLTMGRARGQLSTLPSHPAKELRCVVCRDGYVSPGVNGAHTVGASLQHDDEDASPRSSDDAENFMRLQRLLPGFAEDITQMQSGRVGWRATTQDRLPLVGKLAPNLYVSLGHGARGVTCAPICSELLAAMICREPLPLASEWVVRLDPARMANGGAEL
ncbi:MAG: FAD-dependent 5-carboxymethylaminomethyl-2-thiouridine(34) oxidoreductase MnmC, partial [Burkholderiaceae bacterium]